MHSTKGYNFEETSHKVIGLAIKVHKAMGPGFEEKFYQRALAQELLKAGVNFTREQWIPIYYQAIKIGNKRVDFVFKDILLEMKAKSEFDPQDYVQTLSYLKASHYKTALLINFGKDKTEVRRLVDQY